MSWKATLVMHMNFGPKGSIRTSELDDFPGVIISDNWDKKKRKTTRTIVFEEQEYPKIEDAIEACKKKRAIVESYYHMDLKEKKP